MGKIALELEQALADRAASAHAGQATSRTLAQGDGWSVSDVVCTSGPSDRSFEEQHQRFSIALVLAGSFQYRSTTGGRNELMTPGSILLGNAGQRFECGHEHGSGDRCLAFRFSPEYFERIATDAAARPRFRVPRLPALRDTTPVIARAAAALLGTGSLPWEELSVQVAARALQVALGVNPADKVAPPGAIARVTSAVRRIEQEFTAGLDLATLAAGAGLTPYHFLRTFHRLTGVTPHQFVLRARLREAALRLAREKTSVLEIALDSGFGDLSNFNHAFRAEFGSTPREFRKNLPLG